MNSNTFERRTRFLHFLLVMDGQINHPFYDESRHIVRYFVENAMLFTKGDVRFYEILKSTLTREEQNGPASWGENYQDYLKVIYDLR